MTNWSIITLRFCFRPLAVSAQASASVAALKQAAGDHLRLDFGGALEDIEDARVAEHATHRIFEREAVAAMNLERVVGRRPGDARGKKLGHARLKIAAPSAVLLAGGEIGELAGDQDFHGHHDELAADAREAEDRLAELDAFLSVFEAEFESRLRDADGARRRLDARGFEGLHELLEALALLAAEKIFRLHLEIVEAKLELLHAAIAEH